MSLQVGLLVNFTFRLTHEFSHGQRTIMFTVECWYAAGIEACIGSFVLNRWIKTRWRHAIELLATSAECCSCYQLSVVADISRLWVTRHRKNSIRVSNSGAELSKGPNSTSKWRHRLSVAFQSRICSHWSCCSVCWQLSQSTSGLRCRRLFLCSSLPLPMDSRLKTLITTQIQLKPNNIVASAHTLM